MEMELFLITQPVGKAKNKKQNKTQVSKNKKQNKKNKQPPGSHHHPVPARVGYHDLTTTLRQVWCLLFLFHCSCKVAVVLQKH